MYIRKILKGYLAFMLVLAVGGVASYNANFSAWMSQGYANVIGVLEDASGDFLQSMDDGPGSDSYYASIFNFGRYAASEKAGMTEKELKSSHLDGLSFISRLSDGMDSTAAKSLKLFTAQEREKAYVVAGEELAEVMTLRFAAEDNMLLKNLSFRVAGMEEGNVLAGYLFAGSEVVAEGKIKEGDLVFKGIDVRLEKRGELLLAVDLSPEVSSNTRLRFDLVSADDLEILIGGTDASESLDYPIKGKYISVVGRKVVK